MSSLSVMRAIFFKNGRLRPLLRIFVYIVALAAAAFVLVPIAGVVLAPLFKPLHLPSILTQAYVVEIAFATAAVGIGLLLRRYLDRRSPASVGLALRPPWLRLFAIGSLIGAGMIGFVFVIDEALGYTHVTSRASLGSDAATLALFVPLFILVGIAEEATMRGYVFQNLWEEWGVVPAVALTAALFAVLHLGNPGSQAQVGLTIAGLVGYGVWACLGVLWTRSLWLVIGVHFAWNLCEGPVFGFPVSGIDFGSTALTQRVGGPAWFTGGPFGPEAGATALIALAAGLGVLYWLHRAGAFADVPDTREAYARGATAPA